MEGMTHLPAVLIILHSQSDHSPRFILHLKECDLEGSQILLDVEIMYITYQSNLQF